MTSVQTGVRSPGPLDIESLSREFPILTETPYGKPLIYLDSAATTQKMSL